MDTVIGVFSTKSAAEKALSELEKAGNDVKSMSVIATEEVRTKVDGSGPVDGAVSGATTGGLIGGLAGLLVGLGAIVIPGGLLIGGPLAAALGLTGAAATTVSGAATGALAGGLVGALANLGLSKETAEVYEQRVKAGGVVLAVATSDPEEARSIMNDRGAEEVKTIETS